MRIEPHETTEEIVAYFGRSWPAANAIVDELPMEAMGTAWFGDEVTLCWVMIHLVDEWARHAGQMDVIRDLIDGATGDHDRRD